MDAAHVVQELLRPLAATREAQEIESKRRAVWEQEFEAKYQQRQAETESQLTEMKRQIAYLEACVASLLHRRREDIAHLSNGSGYFDEPRSSSLTVHPGASLDTPPSFDPHGNSISERLQQHGMRVDPPSLSASAGPSNRKRPTPRLNHGDSDSDDYGSEMSVSSTGRRPQKRINNHDKTCYTIQVPHTIC